MGSDENITRIIQLEAEIFGLRKELADAEARAEALQKLMIVPLEKEKYTHRVLMPADFDMMGWGYRNPESGWCYFHDERLANEAIDMVLQRQREVAAVVAWAESGQVSKHG